MGKQRNIAGLAVEKLQHREHFQVRKRDGKKKIRKHFLVFLTLNRCLILLSLSLVGGFYQHCGHQQFPQVQSFTLTCSRYNEFLHLYDGVDIPSTKVRFRNPDLMNPYPFELLDREVKINILNFEKIKKGK